MIFKFTFALCLLTLTACGKYNTTPADQNTTVTLVNHRIYASPTGSPGNNGSLSAPLDIRSATSKAAAGDTVVLRGGLMR